MIACLGSDRFVESGRRRWIGGARKVVEYQIGFVALTCDCQIAKLNPPLITRSLHTWLCSNANTWLRSEQILNFAANRFLFQLETNSQFQKSYPFLQQVPCDDNIHAHGIAKTSTQSYVFLRWKTRALQFWHFLFVLSFDKKWWKGVTPSWVTTLVRDPLGDATTKLGKINCSSLRLVLLGTITFF